MNSHCDLTVVVSAQWDFLCWQDIVSSIGGVFRSSLRSAEQDGGLSASGRHLGWPHFPRKWKWVIQDGDRKRKGRHLAPRSALRIEKLPLGLWWHHFRRRHLGWRHPRWRRRKWHLGDVWTLVKTPSRRVPRQSWVMISSMKRGVDFSKLLLYFYFCFMFLFFLTALHNIRDLFHSTVS